MSDAQNTQQDSNRLSPHDASYLYGESIAGPLHIGSIAVFEGEIPFERVTRAVAAKLPRIPRYRQRLHFVPFNLAHATWEDDPYFDLRNHLKRRHVAGGSSVEHAVSVAIREHEAILNRSRPLWELHAIEGVPGKTVVLSKVHHCLVDGATGVDLVSVLFDNEPEPSYHEVEDTWKPRPLPSVIDAVMGAMRANVEAQISAGTALTGNWTDPAVVAQETAEVSEASRLMTAALGPPVARVPWNSGGLVTSRRSLAWQRLAEDQLTEIATQTGATPTDAVLTIVAEAAARYAAQRSTTSNAPDLRIGCPVEVTGATTEQRMSMMFPSTPVRPMAASERLRQLGNETARIRAARQPEALERIMRAAELIPATVMGMASLVSMTTVDAISSIAAWAPAASGRPTLPFPAFGVNFIVTQAPAVEETQYLAGHEMTDLAGLIPLAGNLGYGVAVTTYRGTVSLGLMSEPRLLPDLERMAELVGQVAGELGIAPL